MQQASRGTVEKILAARAILDRAEMGAEMPSFAVIDGVVCDLRTVDGMRRYVRKVLGLG